MSLEFWGLIFILTHLPLDEMAAILADDNFGNIFLNENGRIPIRISLKFVPRSPIDNKLYVGDILAHTIIQFKDCAKIEIISTVPWYEQARTCMLI